MNKVQAIRELIRKSKENIFPLRGGMLRLDEVRPKVFKTGEEAWSGETLNYVKLLKVLIQVSLTGQAVQEKEPPFTVKAMLEPESQVVLMTFYDQGFATLGCSLFKVNALSEVLSGMKDTIPFYQFTTKDTSGKPFKFVWKGGKVLFSFENEFIEMPIGDRFLLKYSLMQYFESNEVKPVLGSTCGSRNDEESGKSYLFFGLKDYRLEVELNQENAPEILALLY